MSPEPENINPGSLDVPVSHRDKMVWLPPCHYVTVSVTCPEDMDVWADLLLALVAWLVVILFCPSPEMNQCGRAHITSYERYLMGIQQFSQFQYKQSYRAHVISSKLDANNMQYRQPLTGTGVVGLAHKKQVSISCSKRNYMVWQVKN